MSEIESIVVFGGDGLVGQQIIRRGVLEELKVGVFMPKGGKIPNDVDEGSITVVEGDVLQKQEVEDAIQGYDAVLSAIDSRGWFGNPAMMVKAIKNIISGMKAHGVTKLAILSSADCLPSHEGFYARFRKKLRGESGHQQVLQILEAESSSIDWVAMLAPKIVDSKIVNQEYKVERNNMPGASSVTSGELADFMVKVFMDRTSRECFTHNKLGISSKPKSRFRFFRWVLPTSVVVAIIGVVYYGGVDLIPLPLKEFAKNIFNPERSPGEVEKGVMETVGGYMGQAKETVGGYVGQAKDYVSSWLPWT